MTDTGWLEPGPHAYVPGIAGSVVPISCVCGRLRDDPVHQDGTEAPPVVNGHCSVCGEMAGHIESYGVPCNAPPDGGVG